LILQQVILLISVWTKIYAGKNKIGSANWRITCCVNHQLVEEYAFQYFH
jgi:hypothetical protein